MTSVRKYPSLTILVDMDGVVADFFNYIVRKHNILHPENQAPLYYDRGHTKVHPLNCDSFADRLDEVMQMPNFFAELPVIPGAVEAVKTLRDLGHRVFFCTSPKTRNPTCADDKLKWVRRHFGHDMRHNIVVTKDKTVVGGDILIDDRITVEGKCDPSWTHFLYTNDLNENVPGKRRITWDNYLEVIEKFQEEKNGEEMEVNVDEESHLSITNPYAFLSPHSLDVSTPSSQS